MTDYMRRARSIISNLKDIKNQHLHESILTGQLTPNALVTMDPKACFLLVILIGTGK